MEIKPLMAKVIKDHNFWNNWDFKTIFGIVTIVATIIISYTKLEERVERNYLIMKAEIEHVRINQQMNSDFIEMRVKDVQEDVSVLRNYIKDNSHLK